MDFELQSPEHFINIIRNVKKKRGFSTYIPQFEIDLFTRAFDETPKACFNYLMFMRAELSNPKPDAEHFTEFLKEEFGTEFYKKVLIDLKEALESKIN